MLIEEEETITDESTEDELDGLTENTDEDSLFAEEEEEVEVEKTETDEPDKPEPFHRNPRWKAMRQENEELKQKYEEMQEQLSRVDSIEENLNNLNSQKTVQDQTVPNEYKKAFGDNYEAYKTWQEITTREAERIAESVITKKQQQEIDVQQQAENFQSEFISWAESELADLSDEVGIDLTNPESVERNQILKICEDYGIVGADGSPDFKKANEIRMKLYPEEKGGASVSRKAVADIASQTQQANNDSGGSKIFTRESLRKIGSMSDYLNQNN